jgi:RimJ/RimL family protein N-acetyltransferase
LGLSYRLLRQEFFKYQSVARKINTISSVIISMGASDVHNNTLKFGLACQRIPNFQKIKLLTSKLNPHYEELVELASSYAERIELYTQISASELIDHIASTDLMICPASSIALESCSIGIPLLTGFTANNQKGILGGLVSAELIAGALNFNELTIESAQIEIRNILDHQGVIQEQLIRQHEIFNMRTDYTIEQLFDAKAVVTTMRKLQWHDEHLLLMWTNDPVVRQHSFNSAPVLLKNHQHWFKSKMTSETSCTYLLEYNQSPAGVIRFEVDQNKATLNYSVSSLFRNKGLSKILVYKGLVQLAQEHPEIQIVYAHVKADNQASLNVLKQFESTQENENSVVFQIDLTQYRNCQS